MSWRDEGLKALLAPRSVAIVGASENPDKIGGRPIRFMKEFGFEGAIWPVTPTRETVQGLPAYASLGDLPSAPDAVIVAVAGDQAVAAVKEAARIGAKSAVIIASGFGETGPEGKQIEAEMRAAAHAAQMRLIGPNSQGLANFGTGAILSFSTMFVEVPPMDGPVACISQSGAMSSVPYGLLRERGIGVRHAHATGNDCDVTVAELACAVVQDPGVKLLLLYLESLTDPENLARAAALGRERGVPIIAVKSGRSEDGALAAASHTGAIATPDRVVDAFLEKHGIWRAAGMKEQSQAAEMYLQGWTPSGRRLVVISNSGATGVLSADAAERAGLPLARLSEETRTNLQAVLPSFASVRNPIDITAALLSNSALFSEVLPVAGADPNVDLFLIGIPVSGRGYDFPRFAEDAAAAEKATGKPVILAAPQAQVRAAFAAQGVPAFQTEDDAIAALAQFVKHHERMARAAEIDLPREPVRRAAQGERRVLDEARSLDLAERFGAPCARRKLCATAAEVEAFQASIDGPVVLKACSEAIPHKSEHGLVHVGLEDRAEIGRVFAQIETTVRDMGVAFEGVLASEMVKGARELVVGGHVDPVFGPVVLIGDGGVAVEAMPDNVLLLAPLAEGDVARAVERLRIAPLFKGVRGRPPLDLGAVEAAARAVAALLADESAAVASVDINPLIVSENGAVAVDALVEVFVTKN